MMGCPLFKPAGEKEGFYRLVMVSSCCGNCNNWDWYGQRCEKEESLKGDINYV